MTQLSVTRFIFVIIICLLNQGTYALANEAAIRGEQVVEEWCRMCHLHLADKPDADMAPPFEEIVTWEGHDEAYFIRFMQDDHFPMSIYRLFDDEKADVVAYLMSLKQKTLR